ncbi:Chitinase 2 [Hypoxylon texense]
MSIEPRFAETLSKSPADIAQLKKVIWAAKHGDDQLIDFLMSYSLADADPPPIQDSDVEFSTPMLAAIGQKNVKVIEVLLKQKRFNPARQFQGIPYYRIAQTRRGPAWRDEVRILKRAYGDYVLQATAGNRNSLAAIRARVKARIAANEANRNRHRNGPQLDDKRSMPELIELEHPDPSGTNSTSEYLLPLPKRASEITSAWTTPSQDESEASSSPMSEGSEDGLDEEENVYIRRAEKKRALLRDLMDVVHKRFTASGTTDEGESGTSGTPRDDPTAEQSSGDQRKRSGDLKGKRHLLGCEEDNGDEGNDDGQPPKRTKLGGDTDGLDQVKKFACPYYQRNHHRRHTNALPRRACYGPGFTTIHRVKEGLDSDKEALLWSRDSAFTKKPDADKWKNIYTILFPAYNPRDLPSPYHEDYIGMKFACSPRLDSTAKRYEEFLQRELCPRIHRVLESRIDEALESAERDATDTLKSQLQGIFRDVQAELHDEFHAATGTANEAVPIIPAETTEDMLIPEFNPILPDSLSLPEPWSTFAMDDRPAASDPLIPPFTNGLEGISGINFGFDLMNDLAGADKDHNPEIAATAVPFKVKAIYDYTSDHAEDLSFGVGQIITVTDEEDSNWYGGEYVDQCGAKREGTFPQNFVERYKPPTPPRPTRSRREDTNVAQLPQPSSVPFP